MAIKKSELYSSLWASCDALRGSMDASQYKDYVLVMLFIKYISDKYANQAFAAIQVPPGASFADMVALKGNPEIGDLINKRIIALLARFARVFSLLLLLAFVLSGCTIIQRSAHMYGSEAPPPLSFRYEDGGSSTYYSFMVGKDAQTDSLIFFYGGTGCPSWKSVMPGYVSGLAINARVFVLNKRFVADRSTGLFDCGREFHLANNPEQWVADYSEFIAAQINSVTFKPKSVVLVGVSEGALVATKVAARSPAITHLAIIGSGGYSLRKSLTTLKQKGVIGFDVDSGWEKIASDPRSIEKKWYGNPYRWWSDVMDIDPIADFLKLEIPILVGIGEQDESVPVESVLFLEKKFKEAGKENLIVRIYPDADHRLSRNGVSSRSSFFAQLGHLLQPIVEGDASLQSGLPPP